MARNGQIGEFERERGGGGERGRERRDTMRGEKAMKDVICKTMLYA